MQPTQHTPSTTPCAHSRLPARVQCAACSAHTAYNSLRGYPPASKRAACNLLSTHRLQCPARIAACQHACSVQPAQHILPTTPCAHTRLPASVQCAACSTHTAYNSLREYPPASTHAVRSLLSAHCLQRPARIPACHHACSMQPAQHILPATPCAYDARPPARPPACLSACLPACLPACQNACCIPLLDRCCMPSAPGRHTRLPARMLHPLQPTQGLFCDHHELLTD